MKRQFKAGAQAKREVRYLKKRMKDVGHTWNIVHDELENEIKKLNGNVDFWYDTWEQQKKQWEQCRDTNIELKAEVMKLQKQNEQMKAQLDLKQDLINDYSENERQAIDTILKQSKIIEEQGVLNFDMKFAYDRVKDSRDRIAFVTLAYIVVKLILWVW